MNEWAYDRVLNHTHTRKISKTKPRLNILIKKEAV